MQFPGDTQLVSGLYWLHIPHKCTVTIGIKPVPAKLDNLRIVVAKCNKDLPYRFEFSAVAKNGSIELPHFTCCCVGIVSLIKRDQPRYYARLYYKNCGNNTWNVYFAIMSNNSDVMKVSIQLKFHQHHQMIPILHYYLLVLGDSYYRLLLKNMISMAYNSM